MRYLCSSLRRLSTQGRHFTPLNNSAIKSNSLISAARKKPVVFTPVRSLSTPSTGLTLSLCRSVTRARSFLSSHVSRVLSHRSALQKLKGGGGMLCLASGGYYATHQQQQQRPSFWSRIPTVAKVIIGVNAGVFLLWRLPGLQQSLRNSSSLSRLPGMGRFLRWDAENFMYHHFSISTLGHVRQAPHTLVTSFFSHSSPFHLAFNMFALSSLSPALVSLLGAGHFLAFYMTAGVVANLGAVAHGLVRSLVHVWRGVRRHGHHSEATLARKMQAEMQSLPLLFGLGASGAVFALFAANARLFPDQEWMLIFLPGIPIRSETMLTGLVCFDTLGLVVTALGTSTGLGHAAHLTGVMCGLLYMQYLQISNTRVKRIMQQNQRNREAQAQN